MFTIQLRLGKAKQFVYTTNMDYTKIHLLNFRDLGGLKTKDGRSVKSGLLFRSAQPALNLDSESIAGIEELNLDTIFDLRDPKCIKGRVDYQFKYTEYVNLSVLGEIDDKFRMGELDFDAIDVANWDYVNPTVKDFRHKYREYLKLYEEIPFSNAFAKIFEALDRHEKILVHCQGGKDRTGIFFFILLKALGVNENDILKDFFLSNVARKEKNKLRIKEAYERSGKIYCAHYMERLIVVRKKYYKLSMDSILKHYKTFDDFLLMHFHITPERLKNWKDFYLG